LSPSDMTPKLTLGGMPPSAVRVGPMRMSTSLTVNQPDCFESGTNRIGCVCRDRRTGTGGRHRRHR